VLDGGERHVFLGGSRLSRFMETVETMTAAMGQPTSVSGEGATAARPHTETEAQMGSGPAAPAGTATKNWEPLIQAGLAWLEKLAAASCALGDGRTEGLRFVHRDSRTGKDYLRIPVPSRGIGGETTPRAEWVSGTRAPGEVPSAKHRGQQPRRGLTGGRSS
jgi:hypothetical protein